MTKLESSLPNMNGLTIWFFYEGPILFQEYSTCKGAERLMIHMPEYWMEEAADTIVDLCTNGSMSKHRLTNGDILYITYGGAN